MIDKIYIYTCLIDDDKKRKVFLKKYTKALETFVLSCYHIDKVKR